MWYGFPFPIGGILKFGKGNILPCRLKDVSWRVRLGACIAAVLPCRVKISPQYIQGPINIRPVLWKEIKRVEYCKMRSTVILVFHLKEGCLAPLRILHIFPAKHSSFSLALSTYSAKGQKDILEAVKKYSILGTNK